MAEIKNINLKLGSFHLQINKLDLPDHGVTAIIGPSGSGKTTFFNVLVGVLNPSGWSWISDGVDLAQLEISERKLGVVFQSYDLFPHMTAAENVKLIYLAQGLKDFNRFINPYVEKLSLGNCWNTKASELSGGEQQRVALLRALVSQPRILLLDEPFAALDPNSRDAARATVREILRHIQIPVYMITHDENDVKELAQHVVSIANGSFSAVKKVVE